MDTNKNIIFINNNKKFNPQKETLYQACNETVKIEQQNILWIYFLILLKRLKFNIKINFTFNKNVKLIIIDNVKQQKFATYLQKNFFISAKIIQFYTTGSIVKLAQHIISSNLIDIPKKFRFKCLFYRGILVNDKVPDYNIMPITTNITHPMLWAEIDNASNNYSFKLIEQFCKNIIQFAQDFDCFIFIAIKINSPKIYNKIKIMFDGKVSCYIFNFNKSKNMDYYYSFLYKAQYLFYFGYNVEKISILTNLKKILYVFSPLKQRQKQPIFHQDLIKKNVILFDQKIPLLQKTSLPLNNLEVIWKKIYGLIDQN